MTIPPMVALAVPVAMPIPRTLREDVFLPVTTEMIVSVAEIVSIAKPISGIWLVPHASGGWTSIIRISRETISSTGLSDGCRSVWT